MIKFAQQFIICMLVLCFIWFAGTLAKETTASLAYGTNNDNSDINNGRLIFAHVLYRHGDRMPIKPYPTDPWKDLKNWPNGFGQLTNVGLEQHYKLGQWLRKRYDTVLLGRNYTKDEIYIQSTDVDRTLMSALANLAGLYPPTDSEVWNKDIPWQPIPVHTTPEQLDILLAGKAPCPAWEYELSQLLESTEMRQMRDKYEYLFNYLTKYTGMDIRSLEDVQRLNNTLFIESLYNKTLPEWTRKVFPSNDMSYLTAFQFKINTYTRKMARLQTGPLIKDILQRFKSKAQRQLQPDRSVWVYSAHDTTVANVLNTLRLFDIHSPPYTSCILFELRMDNHNNPFVSLFYKNTSAEPLQLHIPECGLNCPLEKMFDIYADILPKDHTEECKLSPLDMTYEDANLGTAMGLLVAIIGIMLLLSCMLLCHFRRWSFRSFNTYSEVA